MPSFNTPSEPGNICLCEFYRYFEKKSICSYVSVYYKMATLAMFLNETLTKIKIKLFGKAVFFTFESQ